MFVYHILKKYFYKIAGQTLYICINNLIGGINMGCYATWEDVVDSYVEIAEDLGYSNDVIQCIRKAQSENEVSRILHDARNGLK